MPPDNVRNEERNAKERNVSELTKEGIADLYFRSLGSTNTRRMHTQLYRSGSAPVPTQLDIEHDFTSWYGGMIALAQTIDPGVELPAVKEMCAFVATNATNFDRAKSLIAA
jgi:hypothetical protein